MSLSGGKRPLNEFMKANKDYYHLNYKSDYSIEQLLKALDRQVKCR